MRTPTKTPHDYQSHRPFLVIELYHRPSKLAKTHIKGWGDEPRHWETDEHPVLVDRLRPRHLRQASVILDLTRERTVKNRFKETEVGEVYRHYAGKYAADINRAMASWQQRTSGAAQPASA